MSERRAWSAGTSRENRAFGRSYTTTTRSGRHVLQEILLTRPDLAIRAKRERRAAAAARLLGVPPDSRWRTRRFRQQLSRHMEGKHSRRATEDASSARIPAAAVQPRIRGGGRRRSNRVLKFYFFHRSECRGPVSLPTSSPANAARVARPSPQADLRCSFTTAGVPVQTESIPVTVDFWASSPLRSNAQPPTLQDGSLTSRTRDE